MKTLQPFDITELKMADYFFIAHLLDRVLVGRVNEDQHKLLLEAIRRNTVLEAHIFNAEKEVFVTMLQDELVAYAPLEHKKEEEQVVTRSYRLEEKFRQHGGENGYDTLEVKEYINYDEDYLAYVEKTVLYRLKKAGE